MDLRTDLILRGIEFKQRSLPAYFIELVSNMGSYCFYEERLIKQQLRDSDSVERFRASETPTTAKHSLNELYHQYTRDRVRAALISAPKKCFCYPRFVNMKMIWNRAAEKKQNHGPSKTSIISNGQSPRQRLDVSTHSLFPGVQEATPHNSEAVHAGSRDCAGIQCKSSSIQIGPYTVNTTDVQTGQRAVFSRSHSKDG